VKAVVDKQTASDDGTQRKKQSTVVAKVDTAPSSAAAAAAAPSVPNDRNDSRGDGTRCPEADAAASKVSDEPIEKWNAAETAAWLRSLSFAKELEPFLKAHRTLTGAELMRLTCGMTPLPMSVNSQLIAAIASRIPPTQRPARTMEALSKWLSTWEFYGQLLPIVRNLETDWTLEQLFVMHPYSPELGALSVDVALKFTWACRLFGVLARASTT